MKIKFLKNTVLSGDGVNERTYLEGQVYEPHHAQERRVFEQALSSGSAVPFGMDNSPVEIKVAPPVETKVAQPRTTKKAK
jgi:hypothetical protein